MCPQLYTEDICMLSNVIDGVCLQLDSNDGGFL